MVGTMANMQQPPCRRYGITSTQKNFTKKQFEVKPVGKPETASWENFISLLEKYFFSVEKLFFSNWALSEALFDAFLLVFDLLWLLSVNTKKFYVFIFASTNIKIHMLWAMSFEIRQKNIRVKSAVIHRICVICVPLSDWSNQSMPIIFQQMKDARGIKHW